MDEIMQEAGTYPTAQKMAERLIAYEAAAEISSEANVPVGFRICQKLGDPLSKLIGTEGFRGILRRALTVARREAEGLNNVTITTDGCLVGLNGGEAEKLSAVLIAHVIGLVVTFLGEPLTLRLVQDVWPTGADVDRHTGGRSEP